MKRKWQRNWKQRLMKKLAPPLLAGMMLLSSYNTLWAAPAGGVVTAGAAAISTSGSTLTVNQTTNKAAINWQSFDIGENASVTFLQPNATAIALNRVLGSEGSQILGQLKGNGFSVGDLNAPAGEITLALRKELTDIQYGRAADRHGWLVRLA